MTLFQPAPFLRNAHTQTIIISQDDPIIPVADLKDITKPFCLSIEKQPYGGYCGFIKDMGLNSWANQRIGELFGAG
ncbi:MAG: hypothetical protein U5L07_10045 [Desulfobacterales bacterium]|nr:hypothetical protein [Desulfobacterales bacterium]